MGVFAFYTHMGVLAFYTYKGILAFYTHKGVLAFYTNKGVFALYTHMGIFDHRSGQICHRSANATAKEFQCSAILELTELLHFLVSCFNYGPSYSLFCVYQISWFDDKANGEFRNWKTAADDYKICWGITGSCIMLNENKISLITCLQSDSRQFGWDKTLQMKVSQVFGGFILMNSASILWFSSFSAYLELNLS